MLERWTKVQKTQMRILFQNFRKIFLSGSGPGDMNQNGQKTYLTYDVTHKKPWNPKPKNFFHCKLEVLPSLLRVRTAF